VKYFLDTSALVKIYHKEAGTEKVLNIYKSTNNITISELSKVEFTSPVHRKFREKEINEKTLDALLEKFQFDIEDKYEILIFSSAVIDEAFHLLRKYAKTKALRSLDCIQLAFFEICCNSKDIFVCSDVKLVEAAKFEGYKVLNPLI